MAAFSGRNGVIPIMATEPEVLRLSVANDALLTAPVWEPHRRGSNWMAVIDIDGTAPGGLSREFLPLGRGESMYMVGTLNLFDPVCFAADYVTGQGKKKFNRWYGVVVGKTEDCLLVEKCLTGAQAVLRSKAAKTSPADRRRALQAEADTLEKKLAVVRASMEEAAVPDPDAPLTGDACVPSPSPPAPEGEVAPHA